MSIENITQTPLRRLVLTSPDENFKCTRGHEAEIIGPLNPGSPGTGTLHCCDCRTNEIVQVELKFETDIKSEVAKVYTPLSPKPSAQEDIRAAVRKTSSEI